MLRYRPVTPDHRTFPGYKTPAMERALLLNRNIEKRRRSLTWGVINILFLAAFLYDLSFKCPVYTSWFNYIEYGAVTIFSLNVVYHFIRYVYYSIAADTINKEIAKSTGNIYFSTGLEPVDTNMRPTTPVTLNSSLNNPINSPINNAMNSSLVNSAVAAVNTPLNNSLNSSIPNSLNNTYDTSLHCTPLNWSAVSWKSGSPSERHNVSVSVPSPSWIYYQGSPEQNQLSAVNSTPQKLQFPDTSGVEFITNEKSLQSYLSEYENYEKALNASNPPEQNTNLLSSFWSHPVTQNSSEISPFFRKSQYQLSTQVPAVASNTSGKSDENRTALNVSSLGAEVWRKLQIDPQTLTQWNANLRMWISQTILDRLVSEILTVNEEFQKYHLNDVRIGNVGLERLRKTAQTMPVVQYIPTLTTLLPFLEISPNQEYLVKRLKELAKGGCMSEFKWNSGGSSHGKPWDDSLATDSEIIIHLLATYLDCQLVPLPNQPDAKPFSKEHFIRPSEKVPHSPLTLAIHQVTQKPPHFRLIVGEEVFEVAKGHNNLFYTILLFLFFVSKKEHGMLGKVNMGRSGVNMLWIIEEN